MGLYDAMAVAVVLVGVAIAAATALALGRRHRSLHAAPAGHAAGLARMRTGPSEPHGAPGLDSPPGVAHDAAQPAATPAAVAPVVDRPPRRGVTLDVGVRRGTEVLDQRDPPDAATPADGVAERDELIEARPPAPAGGRTRSQPDVVEQTRVSSTASRRSRRDTSRAGAAGSPATSLFATPSAERPAPGDDPAAADPR